MLDYKRAVPFTMFTGGVGRHAQGKLPIAKDYMGDPSSKTVSNLLIWKRCNVSRRRKVNQLTVYFRIARNLNVITFCLVCNTAPNRQHEPDHTND